VTSLAVDVTTLSQHDAAEYRRELIHAIYNPGIEFDMSGPEFESDISDYRAQLVNVDAYLATFSEKI
jgi:hypothetical protein